MAYSSGYGFESFYEGNPGSLDPDSGNFVGVNLNAARLGFPGNPQTGNQLGETINALKQGVKAFEVSMLGVQDADQTIPEQHMKEMRALMKLSGVKPSVHGPLLDPAGFGEKGWSGEVGRQDNERRMFNAIERAKALDQSGNLPIVFHSSNGSPGNEFVPDEDVKPGEDGRFKVHKAFAINRENGQMAPLEREFKFRPGSPNTLGWDKDGKERKGIEFTPEGQLHSANATEWENSLTDLATFSKHADEVIGAAPLVLGEYSNVLAVEDKGKTKFLDIENDREINLSGGQLAHFEKLKDADIFLENVDLKLKSAFHNAYKYGNEEQKKKLVTFAEEYTEGINSLGGVIKVNGKETLARSVTSTVQRRDLLRNSIKKLTEITEHAPPELFVDVEEFAKDKAAETFGNLAVKSYDKWNENAPVLAIENLYQGMAFSKADDLKDLVDKSRQRFVDYLVSEKKMGKERAEKIAQDKIGVTWDVGHLNVIKKKGFTDEDVVAETKKMTGDGKDKGKYIKHIHLTDNFGYSDSHLAPGMGNVPFKRILEELEKTGRIDEMNKIVESGGFVQHFRKSPHPWTLGAFGSPLYSMKGGPSWNQAMDVQGSYFGGYGTLNPQTHHSYFGAGFTTMPVELGGQMPGGQSRFDGRPMS